MTFKEFLDFIGQDSDHFWGFILVLLIVGGTLRETAKYIFRRKQ
jgi:hypothetical protein